MKLLIEPLSFSSLILAGAAVCAHAASFSEPVGLQLYSLRAEFTRNVPSTLEKVRDFGIRNVELAGTYNLSAEKFKEMLDANKLKPVSGHFPFERYRDDAEGVARDAKTLGLQYAGCAWIPHDGILMRRSAAPPPRSSTRPVRRSPNKASSFSTTVTVTSFSLTATARSWIC